MKTIKSISTKSYAIELSEGYGNYYIGYCVNENKPALIASIETLNMALDIFETKVTEFEGV